MTYIYKGTVSERDRKNWAGERRDGLGLNGSVGHQLLQLVAANTRRADMGRR